MTPFEKLLAMLDSYYIYPSPLSSEPSSDAELGNEPEVETQLEIAS